jgi:hypothetical protein
MAAEGKDPTAQTLSVLANAANALIDAYAASLLDGWVSVALYGFAILWFISIVASVIILSIVASRR